MEMDIFKTKDFIGKHNDRGGSKQCKVEGDEVKAQTQLYHEQGKINQGHHIVYIRCDQGSRYF